MNKGNIAIERIKKNLDRCKERLAEFKRKRQKEKNSLVISYFDGRIMELESIVFFLENDLGMIEHGIPVRTK